MLVLKLVRIEAVLLLAVTLLISFSNPIVAQDFDRIVAFGDSLSDSGNRTDAGFPLYPPPFDALTRFTSPGGRTWVEILAGAPNEEMVRALEAQGGIPSDRDINFAYSGARADREVSTAFPDAPGVPEQIDNYEALGGTFGKNDLVVSWIGANDLLQGLEEGASTPGEFIAIGTDTGQDQVANIQRLIGLGAKQILVPNMPNIGLTPRALANPGAPQAGAFLSNVYNQTLAAGLRQLTGPDVNIIELDVASAINVIIDNPAAFGFTNVTDACILIPACAIGTPEDQAKFVFWDDIHPTAEVHKLLALYAGLLLDSDESSKAVAPLAEVGLWTRLHATNAVFDRLTSWLAGTYAKQNGFYAEVVGLHGDHDANDTRPGYNFGLYGVRAGIDRQFGNMLIGGATTFLAGDTESGALEAENLTISGDLYATSYWGPLFVSGQVGIAESFINDIERNTGFGPITATGSTNVRQYGAAGEVGALFKMGQTAIIPAARLGYVSADMDGFSETAELLALEYSDRTVSTAYWAAKIRASTNIVAGASKTAAYAEVGYEDFFSEDVDNVVSRLVNNTAHPNEVTIASPEGRGLFFKVGASSLISDSVSLDVDYGLSLHGGDGETHTGKVRVKVPLSGTYKN